MVGGTLRCNPESSRMTDMQQPCRGWCQASAITREMCFDHRPILAGEVGTGLTAQDLEKARKTRVWPNTACIALHSLRMARKPYVLLFQCALNWPPLCHITCDCASRRGGDK